MRTIRSRPSGDGPDLDAGSAVGRSGGPPLAVHAAAYLALLVAVMWLIPTPASFGVDDGAYGGQVYALQQGDWVLERPIPVVAEANEGWFNAAVVADGPLPYTTSPTYALLLTGTATAVGALTGDATPERAGDNAPGLAVVPIASAVVAASAAWLLARRFDPEAGPSAFWILALGPTLVNATTLWAHTLATAAAGLALWALLTVVGVGGDRPAAATSGAWFGGRPRPTIAPAAVATGAGVVAAAVRTEAALWVGATAVAVVIVDRRPRTLVPAVCMTGAASVAWVTNRWWGLSLRRDRLPITTAVTELTEGPGWLASRFTAGWQLLLTAGPGPGQLAVLVAVSLVAYASLNLSRSTNEIDQAADRTRRAVGALAVAAVGYGVYAVVDGGNPISGTVAAWPVAALLLSARRPRPAITDPADQAHPPAGHLTPARWAQSGVRVMGLSTALFTVAILATQYWTSGGLQWGGRYLSMSFAAIAALAAVRGRELIRAHPAVLGALLLAPAVAGLSTSYRLHAHHQAATEALTAAGSEVVITESPAVPRIAWTALPTSFYRADEASLLALLDELSRAEVRTVSVHGVDGVEIDGAAGYRLIDTTGSIRHLELATGDR